MRSDDGLLPDDVDRAFARLRPIEPPQELLQRIAAQTYRPATPARPRWIWLALDAAALILLAALSVNLGMALHEMGALEVVGIFFADSSLLGETGDVVEALGASIPWLQVALLALNAVAVAGISLHVMNERSGIRT